MSGWTVPSYAEGWSVPGYVEERQLGAGASGRVVAAVSEATGQRVAIKYLSPALVRNPSFMWGFRTEAQTLRALDVPQVVQLYDYVEEPGHGAAIVMELVNGVTLHEMISRQGPTSPESALIVLKGSLLGLSAAHAVGIVHRDYKPENVLVNAAGDSKLTDFGVAIKAGKRALSAGTPLYMAPEQWNGAPNSPATDVYAATAVFFECLTGQTPFTGKLAQLRELHETAVVPLDRIQPQLHGLIARGMAKNPLDRPQSAIAFVAELEATAAAVYGTDWEERGRSQLAERVAALLPLLLQHGQPSVGGTSTAATWLGAGAGAGGGGRRPRGRRRRRAAVVVTVAAAVVVAVAAVATAVTLSGKSHQTSLRGSSEAATITSRFSAEAAVSPPVTASKCATDAAFSYTGLLTATAAGTVSYRWVYSSGKPGPVRSVHFTAAGQHQQVAGEVVKTKTAGVGWGEIKLISPTGSTSNKASYKLLCASSAGGITPVASVEPSAKAATCGTKPPTFTAAGTISSQKAETVSYYWAQSDGQDSAPETLTFSGSSTLAVEPLTITPPGDPAAGEAVLVVTSPVAAASAPASYTLTCTAPVKAQLTASAAVSPATDTVASCTAAAPAFTFSGTITATKAATVSYYWKLPNGKGPARTLAFGKAGTRSVAAASYKPASDTASGSGSIVVTSPGAAASNAAAFTLSCGSGLSLTASAAATATVGKAYSATATVTGGKGSYKWTVTGLPAGLTSSAAAGKVTISGTPAAAGKSTIKLTASDSATPAHTASTSLTLTVSAPALTLIGGTLAAGTTGAAYSATVAASGGSGTDTYSAAGLPAGLVMSAAGTISGRPTAAGTSTVTVTVTDTATPAQNASATFTLTVSAPALTLAGGTLASGTSGAAYAATVAAAGGSGTDTYSAAGLPAGLAMSAAGTISGTPTTAGTFAVTVTVTDTAAQTAKGTYTITIAQKVVTSPTPTPTPTKSASPTPSPSTPPVIE
jgi:eukaryotic-like serine/threonine-protein kinase